MSDVFDNTATEGNVTPSPLTELVGEDKKFKTVEDLAKGKQESDAFIEKLQQENKEALDELARVQGKNEDGKTVSELIAALKESNKAADDGKPALSEEDLEKKVRDIMQGDSAEATAKQNREEGNKLVLEKVGGDVDAAKTYLADRAAALKMSVDQLRSLSESSPAAFAELMGIKRTATPSKGIVDIKAGTDGEFLPAATPLQVDGHNTKAYYDALKKEMGVARFLGDHKLQNAYLKDAMALGDEKFNPMSK
jgi:hypothetical protein